MRCCAGGSCIPAISRCGGELGYAGALAGLAAPRGRPRNDAAAVQIARLQAQKKQLELELAKARFVVDVQAKLHALLDNLQRARTPSRGRLGLPPVGRQLIKRLLPSDVEAVQTALE